MKYRNLINFCSGLVLGVIAVYMWQYSKFIYYTVFVIQTTIIYILINWEADYEKTRRERHDT